jgi:ADP-ribose pyrophosphatase YjhB (NUDIX family)
MKVPAMGKANGYERPQAGVDVALFTLKEGRLSVLLARRDRPPLEGSFALPGGFIHVDGDADTQATARRVLLTKVGIVAPYLEQLFTFSGRARDPRGWSLSIAYYAVVPAAVLGDVSGPDLVTAFVDDLPALPFDHTSIVETAVSRLRGKSSYSSLPMFLLPDLFTVNELYDVYRQVGIGIDKVTFRRRIENQGAIQAVPGKMRVGQHRPAQLYRRAAASLREFDQAL